MRITQAEKDCFVIVICKYDPLADIYLFGSRSDDFLKGGDIDLLIASDILEFSQKLSILTDIKAIIGDQKIDLLIRKKSEFHTDPFIKEICKGLIKLNAER